MINEKQAKRYCSEDISLIENYNEAVSSLEKWDIHHRLETDLGLSMQELIDSGRYYNVEAKYLIFLTRKEHKLLHKDRLNSKWSKDQHKKFRNSTLGRKVWNSGKTDIYSEETIQKMRKPKQKFKWLTPTDEIKEMAEGNVKCWHPDWIKIGEV